jgi:prevent-host-death family protein
MPTVGVRELKERTSKVLRRVRERGEAVDVTFHGRVVARLVPVEQGGTAGRDTSAVWSEIDRVAQEIAARWPKGVSATRAVREARRG